MSTATSAPLAETKFDWPLCYEAEEFILARIEVFAQRNAFTRALARRLRDETGTLLVDWTDHLILPPGDETGARAVGFTEDSIGEASPGQKVLWHPEAMLPRILIDPTNAKYPLALALHSDSIADFMAAHQVEATPEGQPFARFRRVLVADENGTHLEAIERRGYRGYVGGDPLIRDLDSFVEACELWHTRRRVWDDDVAGFQHASERLDRILNLVGCDTACHIVFAEERAYWERRNRAGQAQKRRQDSLGLGWGNHDHHTFRSSRRHFVDLMNVLEKLGFERRERYYAGSQAGWGAQILEQTVEGIVVFADVDLLPTETEIDFSRTALPPADSLGTVGLWCGLHGESFLEAGMHHLECRFDHALLREQLAAENIQTMNPFSDFPFLKQAFTEGERWPVRPARAERLRREGLITGAQFEQFTRDGAIGSHLENLQRKGGFKGFNQKSVSVIITATDPRNQP